MPPIERAVLEPVTDYEGRPEHKTVPDAIIPCSSAGNEGVLAGTADSEFHAATQGPETIGRHDLATVAPPEDRGARREQCVAPTMSINGLFVLSVGEPQCIGPTPARLRILPWPRQGVDGDVCGLDSNHKRG